MPFFLMGDDSSPAADPPTFDPYFSPTAPTPAEYFPDFFHSRRTSSFSLTSGKNDSRNSIVFPPITRTSTFSSTSASSTPKSDFASIASSSSFTRPSGAVVPRPPRQVAKKEKTSFGDRRGYGLSIDLSGSDKVFGNHSGRDIRL